jgi:hypothetical protein
MSDEEERDYEAEASAQGWVPEEDWKGPADKWRPAQEFVERGDKIIPILKDRVDKLEADLRMTIAANEREVREASKAAYEKAKAKYKARADELDKKELEAFAEGDAEKFQEVKKEKARLKEPEAPTAQDGPTPEFKQWSDNNPWYQTDETMTLFAEALGHKIATSNPHKPYTEIWDDVAKKVRKEFPQKFENQRRNEAGSVESGTTEPSNSSGNKFADLPASAKKQFARLEKQFALKGRKYSKDTYAKDYFAQG